MLGVEERVLGGNSARNSPVEHSVFDPASKFQLEEDLRVLEAKLTERTKNLEDRLREASQFQNSLNIPLPNQFSAPTNEIVPSQINHQQQLSFPNIPNHVDNELQGLHNKEHILKAASEKLEFEKTKQQYLILLDEERQSATITKQKLKEQTSELLDTKKRLYQEIASSSQKDQQHQAAQRKLSALIKELELTESRARQVVKEKDDVLQRREI